MRDELATSRTSYAQQLAKLTDECAALRAHNEQLSIEKSEAKANDDDELQKAIEQLEKRFEDDYAQFMDKHKVGA